MYVIALLCGVYLIVGKKPWQTKITERHEAGVPAMLDDYIAAGMWKGALFFGLVMAGLALSIKYWGNRKQVPGLSISAPTHDVSKKAFWLGVTAICVLALPSRVARMEDSFWGDEAWAYNDLIHGRTTVKEDGSLDFHRHSWKVTAFCDKSTNNHYLFTLLTRVVDEGWKKLKGAKENEFSEAATRIVPLLAGIGSLIALAYLMRQIGFSAAGLAAALVLALHPWHVRYSSEARGYTLLILLLLLAVIFLIKALEEGKWRWWLIYSGMQFGALYAWKAAIHPVAMLNVAAFVVILRHRGRRGSGFVQLMRWGVANVLTLAFFVPLFLPAIPQIARRLASSHTLAGEMDLTWFHNFWAQLSGGMDWSHNDSVTPFFSVVKISEHYPWFENFVSMVIPALAVLGLIAVVRSRADYGLLIVGPLLGGVLGYFHFKLTGTEMLKWYLFYTLPFVIALVGAGLTLIGRGWFRFAPVGVFMAAYLLTAGSQLGAIVHHPFQDPRGASALTRYGVESRYYMGPAKVMTVGLYRRSVLYDPRMQQKWGGKHLRTAALLKKVMRQSDETGKPLRVTVANMGFARQENRDFVALVEDERYFKPMGTFPGGEEYITIYAWEYIPHAMDKVGATAVRDGR